MIFSCLNKFIDYFLGPLKDVLYPPLCHRCDRALPEDQRVLCRKCWSLIPPFRKALDDSLRKRSFANIYILFQYDETVQLLIHLLKYNAYLSLADLFAEKAFTQFAHLTVTSYHYIIPVPLYKTRLRERGYNQSEKIAIALGARLCIPVKTELLKRKRDTKSQTTMSRSEREMNVKGAFHSPEIISGKRILLVDDVVTTGSTIEACIAELMAAGAASVDVLTIAHPPAESSKHV